MRLPVDGADKQLLAIVPKSKEKQILERHQEKSVAVKRSCSFLS
jgi:hypothetical protein